ncbi:MAG: cytochrome bc complex cytochrome b subunit [Oscillatoriophycideae cyanobacterium NC_groundwater_1537_Pr4_S-0.65um_50_18]|nr:cytochrome bc complex cytochrome b subunit [Oscillatoriophycideae cyanobacterium NC_groundwater_1537_Pr4_S-0.65um_50_18]
MKTLEYRFALQRSATILAVTAFSLVLLAGITGILISYYYEPTAGGAFNSLRQITESIPNGVLIRSLHDLAGNGLIVVALLQIVVLFLGRQFRPSWIAAWISGIVYALVAIGLSWTAIILDWDQVGYWRFKVELKTIEIIPLIGPSLRDILTGGNGVNSTTVAHLYTLHSYVLSGVAIALAVFHLGALVYQEQERRQVRTRLDGVVSRAGDPTESAEQAPANVS